MNTPFNLCEELADMPWLWPSENFTDIQGWTFFQALPGHETFWTADSLAPDVFEGELEDCEDVASVTPASPTIKVIRRGGFVCEADECGKTYRRKEHLNRHKQTNHEQKKRYRCDFCGKGRFSRRDNLNAHRELHTEENRKGPILYYPNAKKVIEKEKMERKRARRELASATGIASHVERAGTEKDIVLLIEK